jgi:hypothetical protein
MPGSSTKTGPLKSLSLADAEFTMRSKFFGPYLCAKYAELDSEGSLTLFSGVLSQRPGTGMPILGEVNAAVEGLGRKPAGFAQVILPHAEEMLEGTTRPPKFRIRPDSTIALSLASSR